MSIQAVAWVLEHSKSKGTARLVLIALANRVGREDGECWPSMRTIASDAGVSSPSTVKEAVEKLELLGELVIIQKGDARRSGKYRLPFAVTNASSGQRSGDEHPSARPSNGAFGSEGTHRSAQTEQNRNEPSTQETPVASGDVDAVFEAYTESTKRTGRYVLSPERRRLIEKWLRLYPAADLVDACWGITMSPHHRGENERGTVYNDLELILRSAGNIEKFRDIKRGTRARPTGRGPAPPRLRCAGCHELKVDCECPGGAT